MGNIFGTIGQGWASLLEAIGLAGLAHSWFGVFLTVVIIAFAVAGAFRAILRGIAGVRGRQIRATEQPRERGKTK
jgi:hypothetical protein